ncbi:MAG: hypothetical protein AB7J30_12615 [Hyphomicrobium sp.]|uniref:hypothetical protein n=1 Tax=Hyphomicrobium sp. TaxID=82 RepID=UPI003D118AAC
MSRRRTARREQVPAPSGDDGAQLDALIRLARDEMASLDRNERLLALAETAFDESLSPRTRALALQHLIALAKSLRGGEAGPQVHISIPDNGRGDQKIGTTRRGNVTLTIFKAAEADRRRPGSMSRRRGRRRSTPSATPSTEVAP